MSGNAIAVVAGLVSAAGVILFATSLTAFSIDGPRGIEVPFGLGLLIAVAAATAGLSVWAVFRRR